MDFNLNTAPEVKQLAVDEKTLYDTLIIGSGPAGLNAALYLKRKGLNVGIIGRQAGGQVADTSWVENYLGFSNITGSGLVDEFEKHVMALEIPIIRYYGVTKLEKNVDLSFSVFCEDGKVYRANSLILATGASKRKLDVPGEKEFYGRGVTYCAICDGPLYKNVDVVVAGGGNSAVEAAIDLSKTSSNVKIIHRSKFRADQIILDQLAKIPNITYNLETDIKSINGDMGVDSITIQDKKTGEVTEIPTSGVFVEIGNIPNTDMFKDLITLNSSGEIITDEYGATNVPGIYAAGDVTTNKYKQIIIAAGQGASAALALNEWYMIQPKK